MNSATITNAFSEAIAAAIPQSELSISQWAATYRYIAPERSARPGRWRNEVVPFLAEIMDTVRQPGVRETIFVKSAQVAGSEGCNNIIGYFTHIEPSPILYLCETQEKAEAWSKESLAPMIRDTPVLAALFGEARTRDSGNTIEGKAFPGGHLAIAWATSPATLSSRPRRVVIMDERDAFKSTSEGDPAMLAQKRATTFPDAVIFKVSTPRDRLENPPGTPPDAPRFSPIEREYENSDQRKYHVPCPHCAEYQPLRWAQVKWDDDAHALDAYYVCTNGCLIEHEHKADMLARGRWIAGKEFTGRAGFFINEIYSPFVSWGEMVRNFLEAKKQPQTLKVFVNTSLGEGWEDYTAQAEVTDLEARREEFDPELLPAGVLVITAGVDVQGNRLECEIVGWGLDEETWSLNYHVLAGDPAQTAVWDELLAVLTAAHEYELTVQSAAGPTEVRRQQLSVVAACIDSGGHHTSEVYRFCRAHAGRRFYASKGANTAGKPLISKPTMQGRPPVRLYTLGTETAKDTLAARLLISAPGPGYCHFPHEFERGGQNHYGAEYFKQLRSERVVTKYTRGHAQRTWQKLRPSARNEALDCRVYAMAAHAILQPNYAKIAAGRSRLIAPPAEQAEPRERAPLAADRQRDSFVRGPHPRGASGGGFVGGWR